MRDAAIPQGQKIAEALFQAWKLFGDPKAIVVLVFDSVDSSKQKFLYLL